MNVVETSIGGVVVIEPRVFGDSRGFFLESFSETRYRAQGIPPLRWGGFVQDNLSRSARGTLRGLHLQRPHDQGKLVTVLEGSVIDVAVDVRVGSPTFGRHVRVELSAENKRQLWIPPGMAHGFCVTSDSALFFYKCTDYYHPEAEVGVAWNDPELGIDWPTTSPTLSSKDAAAPRLRDIARDRLPPFVV